jgi:hypothetical protein
MFAFANMFHFLAHELPRLCGRRFAFAFVFTRPFGCFFFRHTICFAPRDTSGRYEKFAGRSIYLITPRIEQLMTTDKMSMMATIIKAMGITHRHNS